MSTFDYADMVEMAEEMIIEFGQAGFIRRPGVATGPAHNPTPSVSTNHPAKFVITRFKSNEIDGSRVLASDKKALVSPLGLTVAPTLSDTLVDAGGASWKIVGVETLRPAETTVLITLQVRK